MATTTAAPSRAKNRRSTMADARQYKFVMNIEGEKSFEVYRFTFDAGGFHAGTGANAVADSNNGDRWSLPVLFNAIEDSKTMLFSKRSDLVTVKLVEYYMQNKTLDRILFVATETSNEGRT